jgi:hypothetical protein
MKRLLTVALMSLLTACGAQALPERGSAAAVVTVPAQGPTSVTIQRGGVSQALRLPGPVTLDVGSILQLNLQEVKGARPWASPVSSSPNVTLMSANESGGSLVALFRGDKPGVVSLRTPYPCSGGGCAVALFELDVVVGAPPSGTMLFSGAVSGTNKPDELTCVTGRSQSAEFFSVLMEGTLNGKRYFFRLNAYPYVAPGIYRSVYRQPEILDYGGQQTPDPLAESAPVAYPAMGFLNFLPKSASSYTTENKEGASSMAIDANKTSGFLFARLEQDGAQPMQITGSFVCGPAFTP